MGVGDLLAFREYFNIIRQLSFQDLADEAQARPDVLVVAEDADDARSIATFLFEESGASYADIRTFGDSIDPLRYDVIVSVGPLPGELSRNWGKLFKRAHEEQRIVDVHARVAGDEQAKVAARRRIVEALDEERLLSIGRHIPAMRETCARRVVWDTSMADGQFALVSNLPEFLPLIGNLIAAGADFLVLTKNQLLMLYKLAAIFGRDLDNRRRIYSEMLPVVGAGLFWRTVAREVVTMIPFGLGTVPKVAIAFAGTWAVGRAAAVYYDQGEKLSSEQMRSLYAEALDLLKQLPLGKSGNGKPETPSKGDREAAD